MTRPLAALCVTGALVLLLTAAAASAEPDDGPLPGSRISFQKTQLDSTFRSEGVAVGDFNNNGLLDVAAGMVWYEAPDWKMHSIVEPAPEYNPRGYSNSFICFAEDLNGNGWTDIVVVDFPGTPTWWFENPGEPGKLWTRHVLTPVTNNESPQLVDVTGDGRPDLVLGFSPDPENPDGPQRRVGYASRGEQPTDPWALNGISQTGAPGSQRYSHGLGVADMNGNGRMDILVPQGWWEAPENRADVPWPFHPAPWGDQAAQIYAFDMTGNGRPDVLTSSPHAYGIWWHEQFEDGQWRTHVLDDSFSQTHAVVVADINGDGLPDFVTGKRWWAHSGGDPGADEPSVLYWFELTRDDGKVQWIPHLIDDDSGVGTQFEVTDVNGNGLLDIVVANKRGVFLFEQQRD